MKTRSIANRRAWEARRRRTPPLVTDDGFAPHAIHVDAETGCQLWQGAMKGNQPHAGHRGQKVNPRRLAYERAYGAIPGGAPLRPRCGQVRCITPAHQEPVTPKPPPAPKQRRPAPVTPLRRALSGRLPAERPSQITARDWAALTAVVAGRTLAEVAADLQVSRQRVHQLVTRTRAKLDL